MKNVRKKSRYQCIFSDRAFLSRIGRALRRTTVSRWRAFYLSCSTSKRRALTRHQESEASHEAFKRSALSLVDADTIRIPSRPPDYKRLNSSPVLPPFLFFPFLVAMGTERVYIWSWVG